MIKKLFITFLAVLYLGVSSGATLHYQYCMGRLIKVTLWHSGSEKCHSCGMDSKAKATKKCCTDKHQQLKSDKSGTITHDHLTLGTGAVIIPAAPYCIALPYHYVPIAERYPVNQAPPCNANVPVFLRNCTFRI